MTTCNREELPDETLHKRPYEPPAILWEETLEIAGTLRASNVPGTAPCGDQALPPMYPGRAGR